MKLRTFFLATALIASNAFAAPDGALNNYELASLMSGATLSGTSVSSGNTFTQTYGEIKIRKTKGKLKGESGGKSYKVKWSIKNDQWCEKWKGGKACWDVVPLGDSNYQFYKDGEALSEVWQIESPNPGPLRMTGEQIAADTNKMFKGNWQYKASGGNESGTYESHYCADGNRISHSGDGKFFTTPAFVEGDKQCYTHQDGKKRCFEIWMMADGSQSSYRKTGGGGTVTSQTTEIGPSDKCPS